MVHAETSSHEEDTHPAHERVDVASSGESVRMVRGRVPGGVSYAYSQQNLVTQVCCGMYGFRKERSRSCVEVGAQLQG